MDVLLHEQFACFIPNTNSDTNPKTNSIKKIEAGEKVTPPGA